MVVDNPTPDFADPGFDLYCWYIQEQRVLSLLGSQQLDARIAAVHRASEVRDDFVRRAAIDLILKDEIIGWLKSRQVKTLGEQLISGSIRSGNLFTLFQDFYGKGLSHRSLQVRRRRRTQSAEVYARLNNYGFPGKVHVPFSVEHLRTESAFRRLSGHTRLFVFGYIEKIEAKEIEAHAYLIADLVTNWLKRPNSLFNWDNFNEVHASLIDNFCLVKEQPVPEASDLKLLRDVPEFEVKRAFAEIIGDLRSQKIGGVSGQTCSVPMSRLTVEESRLHSPLKAPRNSSQCL